jgi:hypothetical protein
MWVFYNGRVNNIVLKKDLILNILHSIFQLTMVIGDWNALPPDKASLDTLEAFKASICVQ